MLLKMCHRIRLLWRKPKQCLRTCAHFTKEFNVKGLCQVLDVNESQAQYICLRNPVVKKLDQTHLESILNTIHELGFSKDILLEEPLLFSILPVTLRFRTRVITECGFKAIKPYHLVSYLSLVKQRTVGELKEIGEIPTGVNVENKLASYMTQWPTSLTTLLYEDTNQCTLHDLRLKIIQRYLELVLDLSKEEFYRGIKTYPTIKHRPLAVINETLTILTSLVMMPNYKIKSNFYLLHADPENLKKIIYKFRSIGGIDMKEIIRLVPKLAVKRYSSLVEIRNILKEHGISNEAQTRCFRIYTLGAETIKKRLEKAKTIPEFHTFFNHPRFLKIIHSNNTALKRVRDLYRQNKKCLSLNVLSGSSLNYELFEKAPGDRLGKGKDLLFCISQCLGSQYSISDIRKNIKRHPFWINIPLVQVRYVYQQLSTSFSSNEIYQNCPILLYPWNKVQEILNLLSKNNQGLIYQEQINITNLNQSQILSLALYLLEKKHYFTGNGVWNEEKGKIPNATLIKETKVEAYHS